MTEYGIDPVRLFTVLVSAVNVWAVVFILAKARTIRHERSRLDALRNFLDVHVVETMKNKRGTRGWWQSKLDEIHSGVSAGVAVSLIVDGGGGVPEVFIPSNGLGQVVQQ